MSFSSDDAQIANQIPQTINLPNIEDHNFTDYIETIFRSIANSVNAKESGLNLLSEKISGSQFYNSDNEDQLRNVYRKIIDLVSLNGGSINASDTIQVPHEITNLCESAGILAHCTSVDGLFFTSAFPDVRLNRTSVVFTNPHTQALTQCDIVLNYLKN